MIPRGNVTGRFQKRNGFLLFAFAVCFRWKADRYCAHWETSLLICVSSQCNVCTSVFWIQELFPLKTVFLDVIVINISSYSEVWSLEFSLLIIQFVIKFAIFLFWIAFFIAPMACYQKLLAYDRREASLLDSIASSTIPANPFFAVLVDLSHIYVFIIIKVGIICWNRRREMWNVAVDNIFNVPGKGKTSIVRVVTRDIANRFIVTAWCTVLLTWHSVSLLYSI